MSQRWLLASALLLACDGGAGQTSSAISDASDPCQVAPATRMERCWEGGFNIGGFCAVYEASEMQPVFGVVNEPTGFHAVGSGSIQNAGDTEFTVAHIGGSIEPISGGEPWFLGRLHDAGRLIASDGTFPTYTTDTRDVVATGTKQADGSSVVIVRRNVAASALTNIDVSGALPFRTMTLSIPAATAYQDVLTAGHTVVALPSSSTVRYVLPTEFEDPGDRYGVGFNYGEGAYVYTTSTVDDVTLQPSPMVGISGFSATSTGTGFDGSSGVVTISASWDPYPDAVGYIVQVFIQECCKSYPTYTRALRYYFSEAALGAPGCKKSFSGSYNSYLRMPTIGYVQAVTSSAGPSVFPLGWPATDALVGVSNFVTW